MAVGKHRTARPDQSATAGAGRHWLVSGICGLIVAAVWLVFGQTRHHGFVNLDDNAFIYDNEVIQSGVSVRNMTWAFTHTVVMNWHPLTTLSHMLDCELYGQNAAGHHLTSVILHAATTVLLFLVLRRMTGALWASAFVAMVFGIHPLRVESVAWVAERKDVLSGLFFMLTVGAYLWYVRGSRSTVRYLMVMIVFGLGLMCKPMLVTIPLVLLLLDYWPLERFKPSADGAASAFKRLVFEKIPLLLLSAGIGVVTLMVQQEAMPTVAAPLTSRLANAAVSVKIYASQLFWPAGLAPYYPFPVNGHSPWSIATAVVVLLVISTGAWQWRKKHPGLLVGWLWFLVMLLPVIGLVQVGGQAHADRYTYLPGIGLCLAITSVVSQVSESWRFRPVMLTTGAMMILFVLSVAAHRQTTHWRTNNALWQHTLACTSNNAVAEKNLAEDLLHKGRLDEAVLHYGRALEIEPENAGTWNDLGLTFLQGGQLDRAIRCFEKASQAQPKDLDISSNLEATRLLKKQAQAPDIAPELVQPAFAAALNRQGLALVQAGQLNGAIDCFQKAVKVQPDQADFYSNWGAVLLTQGETDAAVVPLTRAVELNPASIEAACNLAWILATASTSKSGYDATQAVQMAYQANNLTGGSNIHVLRTLAAAYAKTGRFTEAIDTVSHARQLAETQGDAGWITRLDSDQASYRERRPLREISR